MKAKSITRRRAIASLGVLAASTVTTTRVLGQAAPIESDVLILGAGIAGLHAAMALEADGLSVTVLEGSGRIGGRCWTVRGGPGKPEFGASQIASAYTHVVAHCNALGLELVPPGAFLPDHVKIPGVAISIGGQAAPNLPWAESPQNATAGAERELLPMQLISHYCADANPLESMSDWLDPRFAALDSTPLDEFMRQQGASEEALRLADRFTPAHRLSDISTLDVMRKEFAYRWYAKQGPYFHVAKGTGALTDAMAASLAAPVEVNRIVRAVESSDNGVVVECADGSRWSGRHAVSTFPTSTLQQVRFDTPVPEQQRAAWKNIANAKATIVFLEAKEAFWEVDGLPPATWSDEAPEYAVLVDVLPGGGGLIMCHINGDASDKYAGLAPQVIGRQVMDAYVRARPAAAGVVSVAAVHDWTTYPFSLGHIAYFRPGDIGRYAGHLAAPIGSLFFAGEHCGREGIGVEAACESAQTAVDTIRLRLG